MVKNVIFGYQQDVNVPVDIKLEHDCTGQRILADVYNMKADYLRTVNAISTETLGAARGSIVTVKCNFAGIAPGSKYAIIFRTEETGMVFKAPLIVYNKDGFNVPCDCGCGCFDGCGASNDYSGGMPPHNHDPEEINNLIEYISQHMEGVGFRTVSNAEGVEQFNSSENKDIRFEGSSGIGVIFEPELNKVKFALIDPAGYTAPTASIPDHSQTREVGETIPQLQMDITFVQNDAGFPADADNYGLYESENNGSWVRRTSSQNNNITNIFVILGTKRFRGSVDYPQGPIKNDSLGNPDPAGRIEAGTVHSNIVTITGRYKFFFGNVAAAPTNSAQVRALPQNSFDNAPFIELITGTTNTRHAVAIPATKSITVVNDLTNLMADLTANYVLVNPSLTVNDANGDPVTYKLYVYTTAIPYNLSATHRIQIA